MAGTLIVGMERKQERVPLTNLESEIRAQIADRGSIIFKEFMGLALTHPVFGYYTSQKSHPGRKADFFTSVSVGACFGELLASYVHECWCAADRPERFEVIEQGANTGLLAADLLTAVSAKYPALYQAIYYHAIEICAEAMSEPSLEPHHAHYECLSALSDLAESESPRCFLANELIDAFPVHRVCWQGLELGWQEWHVTVEGDALAWILADIEDTQLQEALAEIDATDFELGYTTEVNLAMDEWVTELRACLGQGTALLIDYGMSAAEYYAPSRRDGTLQAYAKHQRSSDLLAQPGQQDLTAHVNFTSLQAQAEEVGFEIVQLTDQHHFLTHMARNTLLEMEARCADNGPTPSDAKWLRQFQQLSHPTTMGRQFKVLELRNT